MPMPSGMQLLKTQESDPISPNGCKFGITKARLHSLALPSPDYELTGRHGPTATKAETTGLRP